MIKETILKHVALQYSDKKQADIFFSKILGMQLKKTFTISKDLIYEIFRIKEEILIAVYKNESTCFEIFITDKKTDYSFEHTCIQINNKEELIERCKKYGIKIIFVKKGEKTLLFIKDFAGNIFEIKEKVL
jgi:catechol-2,3-dioxygenase